MQFDLFKPSGAYKRPPSYVNNRAYCMARSDAARRVKLYRVRNYLARGDTRLSAKLGWLLFLLLEHLRQASIAEARFSVWPRNETLAQRMECDPRTVQRALEELEGRGLVHRDPDGADRREICLLPLLVKVAEFDALAAGSSTEDDDAAGFAGGRFRGQRKPSEVSRETTVAPPGGDTAVTPYKRLPSGESKNLPTERLARGGRFVEDLREVISGCQPLVSQMKPDWQSLTSDEMVQAVGQCLNGVVGRLRAVSWGDVVDRLGAEAVWRLAVALSAEGVRDRAALFVSLVRADEVDYAALEARVVETAAAAVLDERAAASMAKLPAPVASMIAEARLSSSEARGLIMALDEVRFEPTEGMLRVLAPHDAARGVIERYGRVFAGASARMGLSSYRVVTA